MREEKNEHRVGVLEMSFAGSPVLPNMVPSDGSTARSADCTLYFTDGKLTLGELKTRFCSHMVRTQDPGLHPLHQLPPPGAFPHPHHHHVHYKL